MIYGYPQPGKAKSRQLVSAFLYGCRGELAEPSRGLRDGPAVFYGAIGIEALFNEARARGDWFYMDNAFLDQARGTHYRVGLDALQGPLMPADHARLERLGVEIQPWTSAGRHILIVPQSDYFMQSVVRTVATSEWIELVMRKLARHTDRPIRVRAWQADKIAASKTLAEDLEGCWAVVTHSSAAAIGAVLAGVPAFVLGGAAPLLEMASSELEAIERPRRPDGRREWAARLAASQWTIEELSAGMAWRAILERRGAAVAGGAA